MAPAKVYAYTYENTDSLLDHHPLEKQQPSDSPLMLNLCLLRRPRRAILELTYFFVPSH
jgi:hypothetical protein